VRIHIRDGVSIDVGQDDDLEQLAAIVDALSADAPAAQKVSVTGGNSAADSDNVIYSRKPRKAPKCPGKDQCDGEYHLVAEHGTKPMCDTYEYVAGYKHGRTSRQVAEKFNLNPSAASSRLGTLCRYGLLYRDRLVYFSSLLPVADVAAANGAS
jgi:hypothetical protein